MSEEFDTSSDSESSHDELLDGNDNENGKTALTLLSSTGDWDLEQALEFNGDPPTLIRSCVHELVSAQTEHRPNTTALHSWDGQLTYLELDRAANRLAHYLIDVAGIRLADLVHVCFEKSIWFFVAILAINKAGAAWVPLDPSHPIHRQQQILKQTRARLALTSPSNTTICTGLVTEVLEVTSSLDLKLVEKFGSRPIAPLVSVTPDHAAYVLFTSGSTGVPKGFVMEHGSVCTSQTAISSRLGLRPGIRILQFAAYVFDLCIGEIVAPLICGATVCVPSEHTRMNNLPEFINVTKVDWAFLTPSFARSLKPEEMPGLELLLLTGEAVGRDVFEAWVDRVRLFTGWGPAETCVFSTLHEWKSRDESPQTIGRPVGAYCWIVDPENPNKLAPAGWIGEVMIQGPTLLREYLNDAAKTNAATVTSLPSWAPNATSPNWNRFFKSGDLCRYNPNGTIEFVSRKDTQVKIRGLRVELGEVEHNLRTALPNVRQIIVDELKGEGGDILAAYFCYSDETRILSVEVDSESIFLPLTQAIQSHITTAIGQLTVALPSYMIPTAFFPCNFMPSITSTKIDRGALKRLAKALDQESLATYSLAGGEKRPPETPMEARVQEGWSKLLKIPLNSIGRDDSFFRIGGDSITAIRFVAFARENGLLVTAKDIFADPRLFAVAAKTTEDSHQQLQKAEPFSLIAQDEITAAKLNIQKACGLSTEQDIEDMYPCTSLQEGLMALTVKQPGTYIAKHVYRLPSTIDKTLFESAWNTTLNLCPNLRTRIVAQSGNTIQAVIREDLMWEPTKGLDLKSFMGASRLINMQYGSRLCRYALIAEESGDHYFVLIIHHAVFDGWSLNLMLNMLSEIFAQKAVSAPEPYSGFISYIQQMDQRVAIDYWRAQLDGAQRSKFPRSDPAVEVQPASRSMRSKVMADLKDGSITKATIIRATWALVLSRYCDSDDICFGTTVSGRQAPVPGIHGMAGPSVATLPIRLQLNRNARISDFLDAIQQQSVDMVPYEQFGLHNISKIHQEAKEACDFSSLLIIQPAQSMESSDDPKGNNVLFSVVPESHEEKNVFEGYFTYPLVIQCFTSTDHIELLFIFNPNVILESQIEALSHHFSHTFHQLLINRHRVLGEVSLTSEWDLQRAREYNPGTPQVIRSCVHQMVERQAIMNPNAIAVDSWDGQLTYSELNLAANRLSHHLRDVYGIQTGDFVHVCFEKSIWFLVSILAINKSGAAWVPLDPSYPVQRQQQIVQQTRARVALSSPTNGHKCTSLVPLVLQVSLKLDKLLVAQKTSPMPPVCGVTPDHAAYALFTSGSTGTPKGLVIQHQALCTSQVALGKYLGLSPSVRMLQFSSFVFDICIGEIIGSWIFGATVCVPSDEMRMNGLEKFVNDFKVNWAYLTSSFTRTLRPVDIPGLELLVLTGEAVGRDVFETWVGKLRLIAAWGPAEACVWNTIHEWHTKTESPQNIGRPVGSYCWIVDPKNPHELAPVGCVGEILIQGPTLLQEYLADPVRTAASVLTKLPKWASDASPKWNRFFKSGDLGYYNADGTIEFVSRKDTQVKIRGLRIELGEVEHHLRTALSSVHWVAVDVLKGDTGTILAAYFCFDDRMQILSANSNADDLLLPITVELKDKIISAISHLTIHLPSYMVPTMFFPCRFMPSVISGKLDRNSLKRSTATLSHNLIAIYSLSGDEKRAPETPMEVIVQKMWSQVLKIPIHSIGRDDSFLRIGGDSIAAIQLVTLARESNLTVTVKDIFADPRLYAVSEKVVEGKGTAFDVRPFELLSADVGAVKNNIQDQCQISSEKYIEDAYPCSSTQEGLMALAVKQPGSYTAKYVYRLSSQIDTSRFKAAWECVLETCSNLRTRIIIHEGISIQTIIKEEPKWESAGSHMSLNFFMDSRSMSQMHYGSRLCRYALVTNQNGDRFFALTVHHSIFDGWSLNIVLERLCTTYLGASSPGLLPYSSFINYLAKIDETAASMYWNKELAGAQRAAFPQAALLHSTPVCRVLKTSTKFPASIDNSITRATILRTAWAILLARYSDSGDICFGTTVSGRHAPLPNVENMPGPTIATVPVRIRLDRKDKLRSLLEKVQQQASEMISYEQFGLRNIARLSPEAKNACDFSSLLVIQPIQTLISGGDSPDTVFAPIDSDMYNKDQSLEGYFNYPLAGLCMILEDRFEFDFIYDSNIVKESTLQAFSRQFGHVVDQLCRNPEETLGNLDTASPWDTQQAVQWNQHDKELAMSDACVHQLFANQAQLQPQEIAIAAWDKSFTYDELNRTSNRVSHLLINGFGVKPGDLIHVCFEKSAWFIVAILAINKAGGAWVPLDPSHPSSRHKQIVQQTGAKIAVASPTHAAACSELVPYVIELSTLLDQKLGKRAKRMSMHPPPGHVTPTDAAYVLFTSGTTGVPKGVVMEHRSVCTSQAAIARRLGMRPGVRILQFSAFVFDVSVAETIGALISGACVCIPSDTDRMNNLSGFIRDMDVTWAFLTPTFARTIKPQEVPNLELLLLAGEAVSQDVFDMWYGKVRLINGWGPAETCVFSSLHEWASPEESPVTIGRPVGGFLWIVDPENPEKLAPTGCVGEIVMQGPTLLREYLHEPTQTAKALVTSPSWAPRFEAPCWSQFYLTGDLGHYNADGTVKYIGRKDTQVKIRGLRIELGEVEQNIRTFLKSAKQVAVGVVRTERSTSLVAYFSYNDDKKPLDIDDYRPFMPLTPDIESQVTAMVSQLRVSLPQYMVPTIYIPCHYLPFNASGKLDRKGLQSITSALNQDELSAYSMHKTAHQEPVTEMEIKLQMIWSEILKIPATSIGRQDSFLALGGDSISAIQLVTLAAERGITLTVAVIFDNQILSAISASASFTAKSNEPKVDPWTLVPKNLHPDITQDIVRQCQLHPDRIQDVFPCTPLQHNLVAFAIKQPGCHFTRYVFELRQGTDLVRFKIALRATVFLCVNLRSRIILSEHGPMQVIVDERATWKQVKGFPLVDVLNMPRAKIGYGTPLSFFTFVSDDNGNYFVWDLHHAMYDGSTMQLVSGILQATYNGQEHFHLVPFQNYINYTLSTNQDDARRFWLSQLEGANTTQFPDTRTQLHNTRSLNIFSRNMQIERHKTLGVTTPSLLRAAWAFAVAEYLKVNDVVFGCLLSGRDAPVLGIQKIIGPTHSNVPCRIQIDKAATIAQFLVRVQEQANAMIPFGHTGLQNISKLSDTAREACNFQHILITQPVPKLNDDSEAPFHLVNDESIGVNNGNDDYEMYPLVIQCLQGPDGDITVLMKYNHQYVTLEQIHWLYEQFSFIATQLATKDANEPLWKIQRSDV